MNGAVCLDAIFRRSNAAVSAPEWEFPRATGPLYSFSVSAGEREYLALVSLCEMADSSRRGIVPLAIREEIARAQEILRLGEDWDGAGSPAYRREVLKRACDFVEQHAQWFSAQYDAPLDPPHIEPGPNGSIDLHWKTNAYELLVNVPASAQAPASFYGDDYHELQITGTFDPSRINAGFLQLWRAGE